MSTPETPAPPPPDAVTPPPRRSRTLVAGLTLCATALAVVAIAGMVRYTRRVESRITNATVGGTIKFLRERAQAPAFTATDILGNRISIPALKGKVVLINFWATWCPPCREEIPQLVALQSRYKDQLQVVGIAQDSGTAQEVGRFAATYGINYPIVLDTPEIERQFPPTAYLPTSFIIDRDGRIAQKHVGMLNPSLTETETRVLAGLETTVKVEYVEDDDKARVANAAQANKIPGIDLSALPADRRAEVLQKLNSEHCSCGCGLTIAQCRVDDPGCNVSLPMAKQIVRQIAERK
jgi:thiol-disulfide isomerase/thioredoxin